LRLIPGASLRKRHNTAAHRGKTLLPALAGAQARAKLVPAKAGSGGPQDTAASHEDTSSDRPDTDRSLHTDHSRARAYPPRSHHNSLFTLQSTGALPGRPGNAIGFFSKRRSWKCPNRGGARWWR